MTVKQASRPVCFDCKDPIQIESKWRRFEPAVILPPGGVFVCGPTCRKRPPGSAPAWESLPTDMRPPESDIRQVTLALW